MTTMAMGMTVGRRVWVALARWHQRLGWPGWLGLACWIAAVGLGLAAQRERGLALVTAHQMSHPESTPNTPDLIAESPPASDHLPPAAELPLLLTQIEYAAQAQHLAWSQADYRPHPPTQDLPASVEVRCTLKGPYLKLRGFVASVLRDVPGASLQEFSLSRASSDVAEVEAKLTLVVFLAGEGATR